jgi:hypothetical protein
MAALVGKGGVQVDTWGDVDTGSGFGRFEKSLKEVFAAGMRDRAGDLALFAADTPFGIDEHCFHGNGRLLVLRMTQHRIGN